MLFFVCQKPLDWYPGGEAKQVLGSALNLSVEKCYGDRSVLVLQTEGLSLLFPAPILYLLIIIDHHPASLLPPVQTICRPQMVRALAWNS